MKHFILIITILLTGLVNGLSCNAQDFNQYLKLTKGEKIPFDTAVVMPVKTYRAESVRFDASDSLITGQKQEIQELVIVNKHLADLNADKDKVIQEQRGLLQVKQETQNSYLQNIQDLQKLVKNSNPFFKSPPFLIGLGAALATTIFKLAQ